MEEERTRPARSKRGCLIALAIAGVALVICGGGLAALGWQTYSNPRVQLGMRAAGAAMEMNQRALQAPGAQALRDAGCRHAMVYSPALMARFVERLRVEEGRIVAPTAPLVVCASRADPPSCETLASTYAVAVEAPPSELLVDVFVAGEAPPRCVGVYDEGGGRLRDQTEDEARFGGVVRPRVF
jgi:hypothetical protein